MNHARPAEFYPARVFANTTTGAAAFETTEVKLCARLCKRKIGRPETGDRLRAKHTAQKLGDRPFQVRHANPAIHAQAFNLKKHWIVGWIRRIPAKDSSRRYHPQGRAAALHRMNLHRRRL